MKDKIITNQMTPEEELYLNKVKDLLGITWKAYAYRGFCKAEDNQTVLKNELLLVYQHSQDQCLKISVYLDDQCDVMTLVLEPKLKWSSEIEYMTPYDGYFYGVYQVLACNMDMRQWLHGMKPIFDRLHGRDIKLNEK